MIELRVDFQGLWPMAWEIVLALELNLPRRWRPFSAQWAAVVHNCGGRKRSSLAAGWSFPEAPRHAGPIDSKGKS